MIIEAACSGADAYPVEIGCVLENDAAYCSLVRPGHGWSRWDKQHEKRHGVSREILELYGKPSAEVARMLNDFIHERETYTPDLDSALPLLALLYQHAGLQPTFTLSSLTQDLRPEQVDAWPQMRAEMARQLAPKRRRASSEARIEQMTWQHSRQPGS